MAAARSSRRTGRSTGDEPQPGARHPGAGAFAGARTTCRSGPSGWATSRSNGSARAGAGWSRSSRGRPPAARCSFARTGSSAFGPRRPTRRRWRCLPPVGMAALTNLTRGQPALQSSEDARLLGQDRPLLAQREAVGADDPNDFTALRDQLPVERRRRVQMRRGPVAAAARRRRIVALSVAPADMPCAGTVADQFAARTANAAKDATGHQQAAEGTAARLDPQGPQPWRPPIAGFQSRLLERFRCSQLRVVLLSLGPQLGPASGGRPGEADSP